MFASDANMEQQSVPEELHRRSHRRPTYAALFVAAHLRAVALELSVSLDVMPAPGCVFCTIVT